MKKRVLFIAPQSYPVTGAESIVNIKILKALSDSGEFDIDLVSKQNKWINYPTDEIEKYGLKLRSINIILVDNKITIKTILQHLFTFFKFGVVFKGSHWAFVTLPIIKKLMKNNQYDYVLTKNSPSLLLGNYLKQKYGLKWVATWNDPYPTRNYPAPYGEGAFAKNTRRENRVIKIMTQADVHVFPSDRIRNHMLKYLKINAEKTRIIPHVVLDTEDIFQTKHYDKFKIIHSGNLQSPRNPKSFLIALSKLRKKYTNFNTEFSIMGNYDKNTDNTIKELGLSDIIKIEKPVSYLDSLKKIKNYDMALIIEAPCEEGIFMPTKVSDFMQCKIPIFAISPKVGVLNDLFKEGYVKYFADVTDVDAIYKELDRLYNDYLNDKFRDYQCVIPKNFTEEYTIKEYYRL